MIGAVIRNHSDIQLYLLGAIVDCQRRRIVGSRGGRERNPDDLTPIEGVETSKLVKVLCLLKPFEDVAVSC